MALIPFGEPSVRQACWATSQLESCWIILQENWLKNFLTSLAGEVPSRKA